VSWVAIPLALSAVLEPFRYRFVQDGLVEVLLLAPAAGLLGAWIVLRGLSFYSHGVAVAAFPGLVLADGIGAPALLGAFGAAIAFALCVEWLGRARDTGEDSVTGLVLTGALALGVILASDVFHSASTVETLLFGSLLAIGHGDQAVAAGTSLIVLALGLPLARAWLAAGFEPNDARALGVRSRVPEVALLGLVALSVVAALAATGALLVSALFVVPAATVRLATRRVWTLQLGAVGLAAVEGVAGLWLSVEVNVPPGAAIAVLAGGVFALVAAVRLPLARRVAALAFAALALAGCGVSSAGSNRLDVVATTTQIGDWARIVGGPEVSVHQLLQPNTDPHEYEPRPADVEATARAKLVLENGDRLDGWMDKVVSRSGGHPTVVDLGAAVPVRLAGERSGPEASRFDPHWWHDPHNAVAAVRRIEAALASAKPSDRAAFARRARAYVARLRTLDRGIAECFARVPQPERELVTDHDAFNYFAARYGIRVVGAIIPSQTSQAQPSAGETTRLIALIRREHVHAVFPESSLNPRLAQAVARETGARSDLVLYGDSLGPAGSPGATYVGMETANAKRMADGFSGGKVTCRI
jgi:ABC-type Zn uptake system ZnuABC Zn-binding protein ZnuA/ABC-type Mn2+/Zn2+ transport system permease subunit